MKKPHEPLQLSAMLLTTTTTQDSVATPELQLRLIVRLPRRYMDRPSAQHAPILNESDNADTDPSSDENDDDEPLRHRYDVAHVADYPMRSSRLGLKRHGDRGPVPWAEERSGGGSAGAVLVMDDERLPDAFSAGLPGGIQLAQLLAKYAKYWWHPMPISGRTHGRGNGKP